MMLKDFSQRVSLFWLVAALVLIFASRMSSFGVAAWNMDEGVTAAIAEVINNGGIPYRDAVDHVTEAVRLQQDDTMMLRELAWILATVPDETLRDGPRAVGLARQACELTGYRSMEVLDVLGVCHAAAGEFEEAVSAARQALGLAEAQGQTAFAEQIRARIELYKQGEAFRPEGGG